MGGCRVASGEAGMEGGRVILQHAVEQFSSCGVQIRHGGLAMGQVGYYPVPGSAEGGGGSCSLQSCGRGLALHQVGHQAIH